MALQFDHCEYSEIYCTVEEFVILTVTVSFHAQTPYEVMNRNNVARMRCCNECDSLHAERWNQNRNHIT